MNTNNLSIVVVIPARMAATRFPGKPLASILGLPMIEHVRRRVSLSSLISDCVVATCDKEIKETVEAAGGRVIMTSDHHERCTDRVAEAARELDADIIVNVQGDEPLIFPEMIDTVVKPLLEDASLPSANLVCSITDTEEFNSPNAPKVVINRMGDLLYISRESIPSQKKYHTDNYLKLKQLGVIAFRSDFLEIFSKLEPTPLEMIESVDMNRAVEHGYRVQMVQVKGQLIGVDVPEDVKKVETLLATDPLVKEYLY